MYFANIQIELQGSDSISCFKSQNDAKKEYCLLILKADLCWNNVIERF